MKHQMTDFALGSRGGNECLAEFAAALAAKPSRASRELSAIDPKPPPAFSRNSRREWTGRKCAIFIFVKPRWGLGMVFSGFLGCAGIAALEFKRFAVGVNPR